MPLYSWKCGYCGRLFDLPIRDSGPVCACGEVLKRDYSSVHLGGTPAFQPHFSHTVGRYVSNDREFRDELKRGSDMTGGNHEPVYPGDIARPTKDDHVFEQRAKIIRDRGLNESDLRK